MSVRSGDEGRPALGSLVGVLVSSLRIVRLLAFMRSIINSTRL